MQTKYLTVVSFLALASISLAADPRSSVNSGNFRIAVFGAVGRFGNEYVDVAQRYLPNLDWSFYNINKLDATNECDRLFAELANADMAIMTPGSPNLFAGREKEWGGFVENGGALVVPDCSNTNIYAWVDVLGSEYTHPKCESIPFGWFQREVRECDPIPAIRTFPRKQVDGGRLRSHFVFRDGSQGKAWTPLLKCREHDEPCAIMANYGKGFVILTGLRVPYGEFFENIRAFVELRRAGLEPVSFSGGELAVARGEVAFAVKTVDSVADGEWQAVLSFKRGDSAAEKFRSNVVKSADGAMSFRIEYALVERGDMVAHLELRKVDGSVVATLLKRSVKMAPLLDVAVPRYRGIVSKNRRKAAVDVAFNVNHGAEDLAGSKIKYEVHGVDNTVVFNGELANGGAINKVTLPFTAESEAGDYKIAATLENVSGEGIAFATNTLRILPVLEGQVVVDEDNVLLRSGRPWFPLGMYHVPMESQTTAIKLGVDVMQSFSAWLDGIDAVAAAGGSLIPEYVDVEKARELSRHPGIAMWYVMDEPHDAAICQWFDKNEQLHAYDENHPTYAVMLYPQSFRFQKPLSDVVAVDSYPIGENGLGDMCDIPSRIEKLRSALDDEKPIIAVLQSFGFEPADKFRCMAYLALTHQVQGIIWYCWDQQGGGPLHIGIGNNPERQEQLSDMIASIRKIAPALMAPGGRQFKLAGGKVHALVCGDETTGVYLLLANPTDEDLQLDEVISDPRVADVTAISEQLDDKTAAKGFSLSARRFKATVKKCGTAAFKLGQGR